MITSVAPEREGSLQAHLTLTPTAPRQLRGADLQVALKILSKLITDGLIPVLPKPLLDPEPAPAPLLRVAMPQSPQPLRLDPVALPGPIALPGDDDVAPADAMPATPVAPHVVPQGGPQQVVQDDATHPARLFQCQPPVIVNSVSPPDAVAFENSARPDELSMRGGQVDVRAHII